MITTELIARALCQYGTCKTCDEDCVDYCAAIRAMKAIEADAAKEVSKDGSNT
jgi:hypothetical protein